MLVLCLGTNQLLFCLGSCGSKHSIKRLHYITSEHFRFCRTLGGILIKHPKVLSAFTGQKFSLKLCKKSLPNEREPCSQSQYLVKLQGEVNCVLPYFLIFPPKLLAS